MTMNITMRMNPLDVLGHQALLGTQRGALQIPALEPAFAALAAAACPPEQDDALRLLRLAGILGVGERAGYQPPPQGAEVQPSVAPAEILPVLAEGTRRGALADILDEGPDRLIHHALLALGQEGVLVPPALLPRALTLGARNRALRPALAPVLGARGAWLAGINSEWQYAQGAEGHRLSLDDWDTASLPERLGLIQAPGPLALEALLARVESDWRSLAAAEKLSVLEALAPRLRTAMDADVDADTDRAEAFLNALLQERSKEVRSRAALLLSTQPLSRDFAARMVGRVAALLAPTPEGGWQITPPTEFDPAWKQDTLEPKLPKSESLGERAWWLFQLIRHLPLAWWTARTGLTPAALVAWARADTWSQALLRAWGERLMLQPDPAWAEALLDVVLASKPIPGMLPTAEQLLAQLPPAAQMLRWRQLWEDRGQKNALPLVRQIIDTQPPGACLTPEFSGWLWAACWACLPAAAQAWDYTWRQVLQDLVCVLAPDALPEACTPADERTAQFFGDALAQVLRWAALRRQFGI